MKIRLFLFLSLVLLLAGLLMPVGVYASDIPTVDDTTAVEVDENVGTPAGCAEHEEPTATTAVAVEENGTPTEESVTGDSGECSNDGPEFVSWNS